MGLDITKCSVVCCGNPEEKKAVLPVECSMILPDYYPDVMKILRYSARAVLSPVLSEESGETVSGNISIEVNYVSEEGEFCFCGQIQPFSHVFSGGGNACAAEAGARVDDVSCRAVNKRRIDVHAGLELTLRTLCAQRRDFISSASGAGAVCKTNFADVTVILGEFYKNFTLEEEQETGYGKPPIGRILRTGATAQVEECHVIQDKIAVKGNVSVKMLWTPERENLSDPEEYCTASFNFPVSRMIDAPGIQDGDTCDARLTADFPEITPAEDGGTVKIRVKICAFARVYRQEKVELVSDMFSEKYESSCENASAEIISGAFPAEFTDNIRERIDFSDSGTEVIDCFAEAFPKPELLSGGKIRFGAKFFVFVKNAEGEISCFEKETEREADFLPAKDGAAFYNLSAAVIGESCAPGRGGAEISADIAIDGTVYAKGAINALEAAEIDEEKPRKKSVAAVVFYYAEKGEDIWEIAKRYGTDCERIKAENELSGEVLCEKTMLIIP